MSTIINATTTNGVVIQPDNSGSLQLATNSGTTAVTIDTSQNVGIGTTSPTTKLQIENSGDTIITAKCVSGSNGASIVNLLGSDNSTFSAYNAIKSSNNNGTQQWYIGGNGVANTITFQTNGTNERMRIDPSGNVGIGTTSPTSGYKLDVAGNFKVSGSIDENVYAVVDAAGVALTPQNGTIQTWTLGASRTPTSGTWNAGESMTLMINDGTAFTVTWTTLGVTWVGGTAPILATTGFTVIELWKVSTTIYGALVGSVA